MRCRWVLDREGGEPVTGEGAVTDLPQHANHAHLILPAAQVLFTRLRLPGGSGLRRNGPMLAFAVEEETLGEPDANQVTWIGSHGEEDAVAVVDKNTLQRWLDALATAGIRVDGVYCETLLLPWTAGEWSLAWDGREGFVRTGEFQGMATDCGGKDSPPLSLRLLVEEAEAREARPAAISLYTMMPMNPPAEEILPMPDIEVWQRELGVPIHSRGAWDWHTTAPGSSVDLLRGHKRRQNFSGLLMRLRPAALITAAVLAVHAMALTVDWALLAGEQRALRQQMESRFRTIFPAAVAVV
ncbi:MAG: general secretion pathway protein GspL, partial [Betaproteobacteria bacterium]|nr:general secretion pathway protein GspL [Betaproteobacteria bacterium]